MKSTFEKVCRKASNEGYYEFYPDNPNEPITMIAVGADWNLYDAEVGIMGFGKHDRPATIELWIYSEKKLEFISTNFKHLARRFNAISDAADSLYDQTGVYEYHFSFVPKAWISDVFPEIYPLDNVPVFYPDDVTAAVGDDGSVATFEKGSLAEFAISHGCDFMDMSTMTTYRGI